MSRVRVSDRKNFDEGDLLGALRVEVDRPVNLLNAVGAMLKAESQEAFREQRFGSDAWAPRMNPNVPGIIADLTVSPEIKSRRFEDRPALIDTGRLRGSFSWQIVGPNDVEAGTTVPYANVLHSGGESESLPITETVQRRLREALGRAARSRSSNWDALASIRWMLNPNWTDQTITVRHPPRPMVGLPERLAEEIENELGAIVGIV